MPPLLDDGDVDVWCIRLREGLERLGEILDDEERRRAADFFMEAHRRRFVAAHGALREILAGYLGADPADLRYRRSERGKPELEGHADLAFNLSHSSELALVAVSRGDPLGVDVEEVRAKRDLDRIARRVFSRRELDELGELRGADRVRGFYAGWTRKEAFIKATGEGFGRPLTAFDVSLTPGRTARLLDIRDPAEPVGAWSLHDLSPSPGFAAALAIRRRRPRLRAWRFEP